MLKSGAQCITADFIRENLPSAWGLCSAPDNSVKALRWRLGLNALLLADPELLQAPMCPKQLLQLLLYTEEVGDKELGGPIV